MSRRVSFLCDSVEVIPTAQGGMLRVSVNVALDDLLEGVSDSELLAIMDIDTVCAWLVGK